MIKQPRASFMLNYLRKPNSGTTANGGPPTQPVASLIDLRGVSKSYQSAAGEFMALKRVNLRVSTGEFVAVLGKSGSGKSTLINMMTGIDRPTHGEVHVAGAAVHTLTEGQIARWRGRQVGVVFQFFQLLPTLTLLENVVLPMAFCNLYRSKERRERALYLLAQVDLLEHAHKLPTAISGGQQQRAAIARALANDPALVVADEPTGNLDSHTAAAIFQLFAQLVSSGKTIVMVTHDHELARRAMRTVTIADGCLVSDQRNGQSAVSAVTPPSIAHSVVLPMPAGEPAHA
jgi:putative ABC transport system ATP-binding protein